MEIFYKIVLYEFERENRGAAGSLSRVAKAERKEARGASKVALFAALAFKFVVNLILSPIFLLLPFVIYRF